jgi:hypothetical protein
VNDSHTTRLRLTEKPNLRIRRRRSGGRSAAALIYFAAFQILCGYSGASKAGSRDASECWSAQTLRVSIAGKIFNFPASARPAPIGTTTGTFVPRYQPTASNAPRLVICQDKAHVPVAARGVLLNISELEGISDTQSAVRLITIEKSLLPPHPSPKSSTLISAYLPWRLERHARLNGRIHEFSFRRRDSNLTRVTCKGISCSAVVRTSAGIDVILNFDGSSERPSGIPGTIGSGFNLITSWHLR